MRLCHASRDDRVYSRIKCEPNVCTGNLEIGFDVSGFAVLPVHHSVITGINRSLDYRRGDTSLQRIHKIAGAIAGVTGG